MGAMNDPPSVSIQAFQLSLPGNACSTTAFPPALIRAAEVEGLAELIAHERRDTAPDRFKEIYTATLARNVLFLDILKQIRGRLAGMEYIALKGAYLAERVYPDIGLRRFSDIDLLVRPRDVPEAVRRLSALDYQPTDGAAVTTAQPPVSYFLNSIQLRGPAHTPAVHLHWHLFNSILPRHPFAPPDIAPVWAAATRDPAGQLEMSSEHLLIHLADHALRHSYARLSLLRDIAEVFIRRAAQINRERLAAAARALRLERPLYFSLAWLHYFAPGLFDARCLDQVRPARAGAAERLFLRLLLADRRSAELCLLAYYAEADSLAAKARFASRLLFPPRAVMGQAFAKPADDITISDYAWRLGRGLRHVALACRRGIWK